MALILHSNNIDYFMLKAFLLLFGLVVLSRSMHIHQYHLLNPEVSKQTAENIKLRLVNALPLFKNQSLASSLKMDLEQNDDSKRTLKSVSVGEAEQIFAVFGMKMEDGCDANKDGIINGPELKCFNKIWQSFVIPK